MNKIRHFLPCIAVAISALLCLPAFAETVPPIAFKEFTLWDKKYKHPKITWTYFCHEAAPKVETCIFQGDDDEAKKTLAGAELSAFYLSFIDKDLRNIRADFSPGEFSAVLAALSSKYGAPKVKNYEVQNAMGATFDNVLAVWDLPDGNITAQKRSGKIDESTVAFTSHAFNEDLERLVGGSPEQRAEDL